MSEENEYIYRIMSIYEFYELYISKKLKLTRLSCQQDKNDGIEFILGSIVLGLPMPKGKAYSSLQEYRKSRYISCWTKNYDSIAMWSLYSPSQESIRIKVKKADIEESLSLFVEKYSCFEQWDRENKDLILKDLVVFSKVFVDEASYRNIRELLEDINNNKVERFHKMKEKAKYNPNYWGGDEYMKDVMSSENNVDIPYFIKGNSFAHEEEIRFSIMAGLKDYRYKNFEEYNSQAHVSSIPMLDDTENILPPVLYADVKDDFIKEICFDPRMPDYKKETLIQMMNIDCSKIGQSDCFDPLIDEDFTFDILKGIIKKDAN